MTTTPDVVRPPDVDPRRWSSWRDGAACRQSPDLFHPPGATWNGHEDQAQEAKAVCANCPVKLDCLQWAIDTREPWAIAGGLSPNQRERIRRGRASMPGDCAPYPLGYNQHRSRGERPCIVCREANNADIRARRAKASAATEERRERDRARQAKKRQKLREAS